MTRIALALADDDESRNALLQRLAGAAAELGRVKGIREDVARQILAQKVPCPEHPMPFPRASCWTCGRNGAFHRAALIALGKFPG